MSAATILNLQNVEISWSGKGQDGQNGSPFQILRRSVKPLQIYGDFSIFRDRGCCNLGFLKFFNFWIFKGRKSQEVQHVSPRRISRQSVESLLRYGNLSIFQHGGRRHLGFSKYGYFMVGRVKTAKVRH